MTDRETVAEITRFLQEHYIHEAWADQYGVDVGPDPDSLHVRRPGDLLALAKPGEKVATMCQGYSEMLASLLRERGIEAQARCGFATYFQKGWYEDHWIVEYGDGKWADAQIDDLQRGVLGIDFDTLDLPPGAFVTGPEAWQLVRAGKADPDTFGHDEEFKGDWFVAGDVLKDLVARQGVATLPWDAWDPMPGPGEEIDVDLFDGLAAGTRVASVPAKVLNKRRGRFEDL
ncbi:hypothetical protein [Paractinoplanes atraurantiacus]|uniref:Transglutaminase-like superfamily protein n=1 Tax=Paractinoplanes atraurantiacus TaxID=1036182 RepID=A0A285I9G0_9ACTN|nr:hypothetical protein [Actinoplanes atraurantiacus]SNY44612.1 hypothetical protein SAMN05421748_10794 [Actinoplanes atraurantiacus]